MVLLIAAGCQGPEPEVDALASALEADAVHDATFAMTALGPRQVGTPEEEEARIWIEAAFTAMGLDGVASEPFPIDAWRPGIASVTFAGEEIAVEALSPSPDTDASAPLRDPEGDYRGAFVLASDEDYPSRAEAFLMAVSGGAAGLVRITEAIDHDGGALVEVGHLLQGSSLPAVAVDHALGERLRGQIGESIALRISPDVLEDHTSYNVVGRIEGRTDAGTVYVVAHYDSWHTSESAFDNALGVGALVQLADRASRAGPPDREIVFLATSGEEQGLQGSNAWVADHADEVGPGDLVLVLDIPWAGEGQLWAAATSDVLRADAIAAAEAEELAAADGGVPSLASDHAAFVFAGAEAVWMQRWPDRHYHTTEDTLDQLDMEDAAAAVRAHWRLLVQHAGLPGEQP